MSSPASVRPFDWWAFAPSTDLLFILLPPVFILTLFAVAGRWGWTDALLMFALTSAMGHYLPGILRAYGDKALFHRFRARLLTAPFLLFGLTTTLAYFNFTFIFLLVGVWGAWHWTMQVYGFARIYDAKAPSGTMPALFDRTLCVLWFGMCVFVVNDVLQVYVTRFYESGVTPIPSAAISWFVRSWLAATVILTVVYVVRVIWLIRSGLRPNPIKFVFIALTFLYLSYTASHIDRPAIGYAMFEMWHDIQYLSIVWLFNLSRARRNPESGGFIRFLFRPKAALALLYIAVCLTFGTLTHAWRLFEEPAVVRVLASVVLATAMIHYYLDGFIWRIREPETRAALGVATARSLREEKRPRFLFPLTPSLRHALLWLLFIVPASVLFVVESRGTATARPPLLVYEDVARTLPNSPHAQYELGRELQERGLLEEGRVHLERALSLEPDSYPALVHLGVLLADQRNPAGARPYLERALEINPQDVEVRNNLAIVLEELGELEQAKVQLLTALKLDPRYALAHSNLGIVSAKLGDMDGAIQHLKEAVTIHPEDASAYNLLGEAYVKAGKRDEARKNFEEALRLEPDYSAPKRNLAALDSSP